jgi:hypothetical protein
MIENEVMDATETEPMSTADLVNRSSNVNVNNQPQTASSNGSGHEPLFVANETENFRNRWHDVQTSFVDEPRRAVEQADQLVAAVIKRLAEVFADERNKMENEWSKGQDVSTEDLRQALRRYRSFFDRLLSV